MIAVKILVSHILYFVMMKHKYANVKPKMLWPIEIEGIPGMALHLSPTGAALPYSCGNIILLTKQVIKIPAK